MYDICELLQGDVDHLHNCLTSRTIPAASSSTSHRTADILVTDLTTSEASSSRDALCRALYGRLFAWMVNRANESIGMKKASTRTRQNTIGVLDLYGFECAQTNGFEQLVINYANEKLHQLVTASTLAAEQEEYAREGIEWTGGIEYFDNTPICDAIERSGTGLLSLLDEVAMRKQPVAGFFLSPSTDGELSPAALSARFVDRIDEVFADRHPHLEIRGGGHGLDYSFRVKHFAGSVTYDARDFVERNVDALDRDISRALFDCAHPLLKVLFPEGNPRRTNRRRPATAGTQFKISLGSLLGGLRHRRLHYVRCLKPNESRQQRAFDEALVRHQVVYHGLCETATLRRQGFSGGSFDYGHFLFRYKMLSAHTWPHWRGPVAEGVTYLLRDIPVSANEYAFGRTRLFIKSAKTVIRTSIFCLLYSLNFFSYSQRELLEEHRRAKLDDLAVTIQAAFRGHAARQRLGRLHDSQVVISTYWKRWKERSHISDLKQRRQEEWAATLIQKQVRKWQRARFLEFLAAHLPSESPLSKEWPASPAYMKDANAIVRRLHHKWRVRTGFELF